MRIWCSGVRTPHRRDSLPSYGRDTRTSPPAAEWRGDGIQKWNDLSDWVIRLRPALAVGVLALVAFEPSGQRSWPVLLLPVLLLPVLLLPVLLLQGMLIVGIIVTSALDLRDLRSRQEATPGNRCLSDRYGWSGGDSFVGGRRVKQGGRPADGILMAPRPERGWGESTRAAMLRRQYRCAMCHKNCLIPCRFTASEFREMAEDLPVGECSDRVAGSD